MCLFASNLVSAFFKGTLAIVLGFWFAGASVTFKLMPFTSPLTITSTIAVCVVLVVVLVWVVLVVVPV